MKIQATFLWLAAAVLMLRGEAVLAVDVPSPPVAPTKWVARSWLSEDGLPLDTVNAVVQTRDGFLWVGTNAGLARFDGVRFRRFGLQDGLRSVRILTLAEDRHGALWIGTSGGGVSRLDNERFTTFGVEEGFPTAADVMSLAPDRDGSLWIGTADGLVLWSGGKFARMGEAQGLPRKQVRALLLDSRGTLWVSVTLDGLYKGTLGKFTRIEGDGPLSGDVYCFLEDSDGTIWVGANRLWKWSGGAWLRLDASSGLPAAGVQALVRSSDGTLWVGITNKGLYRSSGGRFGSAAQNGIPSPTFSVKALCMDREGSVWAGQAAAGLTRLSPRVLEYWEVDAEPAPVGVTSVVEDATGVFWAGTARRGIFRLENGRFNPLADPTVPGTYKAIYATATAGDGSVWAVGPHCVFRFQLGEPTKAYLEPPVLGEAVRVLCGDGDAMWIGTYSSALLKADASGVQVVAAAGTFGSGINCIAREAADTLWVGTTSGLHRWESGKLRTWTTRDGLLTGNIRTLHRDDDGTLWIGTMGGGLGRFRDGRFINFTTREGLVDDVISQILPDDFGHLWLGSNRGIMRLDRRELDAMADGKLAGLHPMIFGRNEGMTKEQCSGGTSPTACKTRDGRLLLPTISGVVEIDPQRLQNRSTQAPEAKIDEVCVDERPQVQVGELVIPPGRHRLDVTFTAPVLRGGEWVRFRHRLDGFDRDWSTGSRNRLASYDGLPPGRYILRAAAADPEGNWSASQANLAFTVQPFLWQTLWFRICGVLLLVGASAAAVWTHLRLKHFRQLAELERERVQQADLVHASRVSTAGQLTGALAHELNQPLGIILSNAQAAQRMLDQESPDPAELREILADIVGEDRRAGEVIKRLRALLKRGEARLVPVSLNQIIEDVVRLMRSELLARGVTIETKLAADLPDITGDHVQLQQVLLNLIINGCDAMADNPSQERIIQISTGKQEGKVRASVKDRGCGLPDQDANRVFQPFITSKPHGMGIGLSICRSIIAAHHGCIWAESNSGPGTTFHMELQIAEPSVS